MKYLPRFAAADMHRQGCTRVSLIGPRFFFFFAHIDRLAHVWANSLPLPPWFLILSFCLFLLLHPTLDIELRRWGRLLSGYLQITSWQVTFYIFEFCLAATLRSFSACEGLPVTLAS